VSNEVSNEAIIQFGYAPFPPFVPTLGAKRELKWTKRELTMNRKGAIN